MICPRCLEDTMKEPKVRNALSRRDNNTYICSNCGTEEALIDDGIVLKTKTVMEKENRIKNNETS